MNKVLEKTILRSNVTFKNTVNIIKKFASTYKAAVIVEAGKPLEIQEKERQKLTSKQVRVQVNYSSANLVDATKIKTSTELPFIPGYELAGEVLEIGKDIKGTFAVGDRVAGLNLEKFGGLAQECVLDVDDVWRIPGDLNRKDAAVIVYGHSTALYAFAKLAPIKEKELVVVGIGAAGLGLAAVDVAASMYKADVIGIVDNEELGEVVRNKGAFKTIPFNEKITKKFLAASNQKGASVVYDAVGEHMLELIGTCAKVGGKVFHAEPIFYKTLPAPVPHTFQTVLSLKVLRNQNKNLYRTVVSDTLEMANEGVLTAHVSAEFCLSEVNKAIQFIMEKKCTGKVLINVEC